MSTVGDFERARGEWLVHAPCGCVASLDAVPARLVDGRGRLWCPECALRSDDGQAGRDWYQREKRPGDPMAALRWTRTEVVMARVREIADRAAAEERRGRFKRVTTARDLSGTLRDYVACGNGDGSSIRPGLRKMEAIVGEDKKRIAYWLDLLVDGGLLIVTEEPRKGCTTVYRAAVELFQAHESGTVGDDAEVSPAEPEVSPMRPEVSPAEAQLSPAHESGPDLVFSSSSPRHHLVRRGASEVTMTTNVDEPQALDAREPDLDRPDDDADVGDDFEHTQGVEDEERQRQERREGGVKDETLAQGAKRPQRDGSSIPSSEPQSVQFWSDLQYARPERLLATIDADGPLAAAAAETAARRGFSTVDALRAHVNAQNGRPPPADAHTIGDVIGTHLDGLR